MQKSAILRATALATWLLLTLVVFQQRSMSQNREHPRQKMGQVLIAKETIERHERLEPSQFEIKTWPLELIPDNAITRLDELSDVVSRSRIPKNSPILIGQVVAAERSRKIELPIGMSIICIKVSEDSALGGLLQPGYLVDVLSVEGRGDQKRVKTLMRSIKVFSIESQTQSDADLAKSRTFVGLMVNKKQAETLALATRSDAVIKLAIVSPESENSKNPRANGGIRRQRTSYQRALGKAARLLDQAAADLEEESRYEKADQLRRKAHELRMLARKEGEQKTGRK